MDLNKENLQEGHLYSVGSLFNENKTYYQEEGCQIDLNDTGLVLTMYFHGPSESEIKSVREGKFTIGFKKLDSVIFVSIKLGEIPHQTCPYTVHLSKNLSNIKYPNDGEGLPIQIFLINSDTGILEAMRVIGLSTKFSKELLDTVSNQSLEEFDVGKYQDDINANYKKYDDATFMKLCIHTFKLKDDNDYNYDYN